MRLMEHATIADTPQKRNLDRRASGRGIVSGDAQALRVALTKMIYKMLDDFVLGSRLIMIVKGATTLPLRHRGLAA